MALLDHFTSTGLAGPQVQAWAEAFDSILDGYRTALEALLTAPDVTAATTPPPWALDILGAVLATPRRAAWSDADYYLALRAAAVAAHSRATLPSLWDLAEFLSPSAGASVYSGPMGAVFWLPGAADLSDVQRAIVGDAVLRAVDAVAGVAVLSLPATIAPRVFTLDDPLRGLDHGLLADTIYMAP